jgi:hypothetical protein
MGRPALVQTIGLLTITLLPSRRAGLPPGAEATDQTRRSAGGMVPDWRGLFYVPFRLGSRGAVPAVGQKW